jgi:hypothetical protein
MKNGKQPSNKKCSRSRNAALADTKNYWRTRMQLLENEFSRPKREQQENCSNIRRD